MICYIQVIGFKDKKKKSLDITNSYRIINLCIVHQKYVSFRDVFLIVTKFLIKTVMLADPKKKKKLSDL